MRIYIDPVNRHSEGAKLLAQALGARRIRAERSAYRARPTDIVINWGHSSPLVYRGRRYYDNRQPIIVNTPDRVTVAANKELTLGMLLSAGVSVPEFTTNRARAEEWAGRGRQIVSRALLRAYEGRGMVVGSIPADFIDERPVRLWTKYVRGKEFRVHVFKDKVIDIQQKKRDRDRPILSDVIRSHSNGWVFCREGVNEPPERELISNLAVQGIVAVGLDFGAVDIRYSVKKNQAWILEINSQPGLEGSTVTTYANAIKEMASV